MRRFSTVPFKGTKEQEAELVAWLEEHKATPGVAMPALQKAQEIYGYLPIEVAAYRGQYAGQTSGGNLWNFHVLFAVQPLSEG